MNKVVQILSVLFIIAFAKASLAQDIQRIEPPFWWAGMEKSEIQIMMYGEDLYNYEAISTDLNLIEIKKPRMKITFL
ncbi:hypothetical protein JCM19297_3130 [Nonlabens ulvanivorans]|nr:hypothetical protein JCM19297_3130 [Nonlabens ulvanivorans]